MSTTTYIRTEFMLAIFTFKKSQALKAIYVRVTSYVRNCSSIGHAFRGRTLSANSNLGWDLTVV